MGVDRGVCVSIGGCVCVCVSIGVCVCALMGGCVLCVCELHGILTWTGMASERLSLGQDPTRELPGPLVFHGPGLGAVGKQERSSDPPECVRLLRRGATRLLNGGGCVPPVLRRW